MVVMLTLAIGLVTPPVGVVLFVVMRVGQIGMLPLLRALMPFLIAELVRGRADLPGAGILDLASRTSEPMSPRPPVNITAIETVVVNAIHRNWIFVKVLTDQPGLYGWGEATLEWKTRAVVGTIEDLAPFVVGEDPRRIEHRAARA